MKKIYLIITLLCLYNCGSHPKKISRRVKIERLTDSLDFKVVLPKNWKPILDSHQNLSYSPRNLGDIFYKNIVRIYDYEISDENEKNVLRNFVTEHLRNKKEDISIQSDKLNTTATKYGETYITVEEYNWNFTHYIQTTCYFRHNEKIFMYQYSSDEKFYKKYYNDADFIFKNLELDINE